VSPLDDVRTWLGEQVRTRVVGPAGDARRQQLFDDRGARWFADDRPIRVVHSDAAMFVGGLRALLLQSLHPLAMAGVAEHSDYRSDPWGRLQRTADFLAATTFGPAAPAQAAIDRVRAVHERVHGTAPDGRRYAATDPHLLRWVHLAELDSFLTAHDRYGTATLTDVERDGYIADMAVIARKLGVPAPPTSVRGLGDQLKMYRGELRGTAAARDAARYLLLQPPIPLAARPAYSVLAAAAVSMLPVWARHQLRLPWFPIAEAVAVRPAGDAVTRVLRWAIGPGSAARPAAVR
jgi:uncharacterized protein (DUF2236 family)